MAVFTLPLPILTHSIPPITRLRVFWLSWYASSRLCALTYFCIVIMKMLLFTQTVYKSMFSIAGMIVF